MAEKKGQVAKGLATDAKGTENREYRLKTLYKETVVPELMKKFNYKNVNEVPRLEKIVLNMGLGEVKDNSKSFQVAVGELQQISGQKPIITKAKKKHTRHRNRPSATLRMTPTMGMHT